MPKKIKVLILSHSSELGGAELSMIDLFDTWTARGLVEPHFIVRKPLRNMIPKLKDKGWKYYPLYYTNWSQRQLPKNSEEVFIRARENARAILKIEKLIKKIQPDIIMTNTIVSPWAAIAAYFNHIPHVWFVREYGDADHKHIFEIGREKMFEDIGTLSDLVVTNSQTLKDHAKQYIKNTEIRTLYTPFNIDAMIKNSKEESNNPFKHKDSLKLVITGRIAPSKGQHEAAQAVGELNNKGYLTELCIIGEPSDPEDINQLKAAIDKYSIQDKIHLVGHKANPLATVKHADVGIMSSHREAFGRVTFEYMAIGLPVVGANSGATPELIDDKINGFIYQKGSVSSLTNKLLNYAKDNSLVQKHGELARTKTINMMQGSNSADKLIGTIQKIVKDERLQKTKHPLNFSHKWLQYPLIAQKYINESKEMSIKRFVAIRARTKLKDLYLKLTDLKNGN